MIILKNRDIASELERILKGQPRLLYNLTCETFTVFVKNRTTTEENGL